MSIFCLVGIVQ